MVDAFSPGMPVDVVELVVDDERLFRRLENNVDNEFPEVDDAAGVERFCSVEVIEELSCDSIDCTPEPVEVPVACATAAVWLAAPDAFVVGGGSVKAVNVDAAEEFPA